MKSQDKEENTKMNCKDCRKHKGCALERRGICTDFEKKGEKDSEKT